MDPRRLSTFDILFSGVLNKQRPDTDVPEDREVFDPRGDEWLYLGDEAVAEAINAGKVVKALNYYGIPIAWKESEGVYRGTLLQYREVTDNQVFGTAEDAAEWFSERYYATE